MEAKLRIDARDIMPNDNGKFSLLIELAPNPQRESEVDIHIGSIGLTTHEQIKSLLADLAAMIEPENFLGSEESNGFSDPARPQTFNPQPMGAKQ